MKICNVCGQPMDDNAAFCTKCGAPFAQNQSGAYQQQTYQQPAYQQPAADPYDHTAEFDPKDISDNKVIAMLVYLLGAIGIIIALLAANQSPYAGFHVRQALKLTVLSILLAFLCIIPILGWIVAGIGYAIIFVLEIIAFFSICNGKAKELPIVRGFGFLK